jgi:hypothetical protein
LSTIFIDGFDGYGSTEIATTDLHNLTPNFVNRILSAGYNLNALTGNLNYPTASTDTRTGTGFSLEFPGSPAFALAYSFQTISSGVAGFAWKANSPLQWAPIFLFYYDNFDGGYFSMLQLYLTATGALSLVDGSGNLIAHSNPNTVFLATWHYIEVKFTSTQLIVRVDTIPVITYTYSSAHAWSINSVMLPGQIQHLFDDMYILANDSVNNTDFLGDCVVHTIFPNADTTTNQMSVYGGSGLSHVSCINTTPGNQDASYLYSNTIGQTELFTLPALPTDMIDIFALQVNVRSKKDSIGTSKYKAALLSRGTTGYGSVLTPPSNYLESHSVWEQDPAGGAWTPSTAQNVAIGMTISS